MITPEQIEQMARELGIEQNHTFAAESFYMLSDKQITAYTARVIELCKEYCETQRRQYISPENQGGYEVGFSDCLEALIDLKPTNKEG